MPTLLAVDDEPNVLYSLRKGLETETLRVLTASSAGEGIEMVRTHRPDAVILDVRLPDMSGLDAFDHIREIDPRLPVVVITAYSATETAISAMKRGAFEYLLKPVDFRQLREVVSKAVKLSRLRHVPAILEGEESLEEADRIVGHSAAMQEVYKTIGRVAPLDVTVLILGESGTGKELVARALYHHSRRGDAPFLAINCAAIPDALLESELFGHERGAFTGADRRRIGSFEQANGGTIFLDEIGDMSPATQAKVLRLLQDGQFKRLGDNEMLYTDVRVIAATNQNLEAMVAAGTFRQDLFYRLNSFTIELPPLRDRRDDVPDLVEYFVARFNQELGREIRSVAPEAMRILETHDWPGNIRELQNVVSYAMVHAVTDVITPDCLPPGCQPGDDSEPSTEGYGGGDRFEFDTFVRGLLETGEPDIYRRAQAEFDRIVLGEVLRYTGGSQIQASELLGMSRTTLRAKLRSLGLAVEKQVLKDSGHDGQNLSTT